MKHVSSYGMAMVGAGNGESRPGGNRFAVIVRPEGGMGRPDVWGTGEKAGLRLFRSLDPVLRLPCSLLQHMDKGSQEIVQALSG